MSEQNLKIIDSVPEPIHSQIDTREPLKVDQEIADVHQIFEDLQFFAKGLGTEFKAFTDAVGFYMHITEIPWKTNE